MGWEHESVHIAAYDPEWPVRAAAEIARVTDALGPWLTHGVHHVGSTSVPGLAAKPILDLVAGVGDLDGARGAPLDADWRFVPIDRDGNPWRRLFVKVNGDRRVAHLHLVIGTSPPFAMMLGFRDRLRGDPDLVAAYEALKQDLAVRYRDQREAYTLAKAGFIANALAAN